MCIAIYKNKKASLPKKSILKICWENNDDGAGFAFHRNNKWKVVKGLMTFNDFWEEYQSFNPGKNDEIVYHFRIGTSGKIDQTATHPFPISDKITDLKKLKYDTDHMMVHNGILGDGDLRTGLSDTQVYIRDVLYHLKPLLNDDRVHNAISGMTVGSRLLLAIPGKVIRTGSWIYDKPTGIYFSNKTYEKKKKSNWFWNNKYEGDKGKWAKTDIVHACPICGETEMLDADYGEVECLTCHCIFEYDGMVIFEKWGDENENETDDESKETAGWLYCIDCGGQLSPSGYCLECKFDHKEG